MSSAPGTLTGIKVVEVGEGIAGPFGTRLLAMMGAEVVKFEDPVGGDWTRRAVHVEGEPSEQPENPFFYYLNADKMSVTADLSTEAGRVRLLSALSDADVLLVAGSARQIRTWGLTEDDLRERFPRLVLTTITPYGFAGTMSELDGDDLT
ncbi:MAG TPA: CoA transferase, partial [Acidimicrobiales bacterium]